MRMDYNIKKKVSFSIVSRIVKYSSAGEIGGFITPIVVVQQSIFGINKINLCNRYDIIIVYLYTVYIGAYKYR